MIEIAEVGPDGNQVVHATGGAAAPDHVLSAAGMLTAGRLAAEANGFEHFGAAGCLRQ